MFENLDPHFQYYNLPIHHLLRVTRYNKLIGGFVRSFVSNRFTYSLTVNNYSIMQYSFVMHARHNVVNNYLSINFVKIRIKMEYGRITLKTAKIRIGYG